MRARQFNPVRIPPELRVSAAERLVSAPDRKRAARHLVENAQAHGINLDLLWGSIDHTAAQPFVRQVVMGVPTAGRTGMVFLSPPSPERRFGPGAAQSLELTACLRTMLDEFPAASPTPIGICQVLAEPEHRWAEQVCLDAGMTCVGRLSFLRLPWPARLDPVTDWPAGVTLHRVRDPLDFSEHGCGTALAAALEATYEHTLDCPELCGLRPTRDVIASHMATGQFDPNRWWIVRLNDRPEGCCLLNHCPAQRSIELVYLGLSSRTRGLGLGRRLLTNALLNADASGVHEVTCAVDTRNTPALKLYHTMGFRAFSARVGFVMPTRATAIEAKPIAMSDSGATIGTSGGQ